jgi:hypothetical protein
LPHVLPVVFLLLFFGPLFGDLLFSHMLRRKADGLYSGGSTWGDLAWHLSMLSNFAQRGLSAVRENPLFSGEKLVYPFLPDLFSAWLLRCGLSLQASLILPTFTAIMAAVVGLYFLARSMTGSTFAALAAPFLYFFNGSLVGCYYLWQDHQNSHADLLSLVVWNHKDYAHLIEHNLQFSNVISDFVLPQRASVFGLCLGVLVVEFLWRYWERSQGKDLVGAGVVLSLLPLVHFHSFVALALTSGFLFFIQLFTERRNWKRVLRNWSAFAIPLFVLALPQTLWITPSHAGRFLRIQWGWMTGNGPLWLFWLKNLTPHLPVFLIALYFARPKLKTFYLAFIGLFLVANIVVFQPYDWDNMKLMLLWFLVSCVLAGSLLADLWRESRAGPLLASTLAGTLLLTGMMSVYRELHVSWLMFSSEDVALAEFVKNHTSKDAIFLTSDKHNQPIACLAGRRIIMGYRGWLWTHGIDYEARQRDVFDIYRGAKNALELMRQHRVQYVLIEQDKIRDFHENSQFFAARFPALYQSQNYTIFKISDDLLEQERQRTSGNDRGTT